MTACLGVILNKDSNTQKFFGGGEVDNTSKQVASSANHHNNDVMCMDVNTSGGRNLAVTGQVGKFPPVFVWNTETGEKISRVKLDKGSRAVAAVCISPDGSHIACADKHNDHYVSIWNTGDSSAPIFKDKGGPDDIFDICFSKQPGDISCWSAGKKHFYYWNVENGKKKKGIFAGKDMTSFACCTADD